MLPSLASLHSPPSLQSLSSPDNIKQDTMSNVDYQNELVLNGVVVVPTPLSLSRQKRAQIREAFDQSILTSPEFKDPQPTNDKWLPVLGGFAALGNASSFHSQFSRLMREMTLAQLLEEDVLPTRGRKVECAFDRMLLRKPGQTVTIDGDMHRDECPHAKPGDDVFGGWINLDDRPQVFRCALGSHVDVGSMNHGMGFAKLSDAEKTQYASRLVDISIPPGSIIVFYERIVHLVSPSTAIDTMYRMFIGFRLTFQNDHMMGDEELQRVVLDQAVPRLKSNQIPRLWPKSYQNFSRMFQPLTDWSTQTFVPSMIETVVVKSSNTNAWYHDRPFLRVPALMKSLRELKLPMHPPYSNDELSILRPQRSWILRTFDDPVRFTRVEGIDMKTWNAYELTKKMGYEALRPRPEFEYPS
jgi:hypothetical protein